eukprot:6190856-Pleurochrysis_carterae.AAC.3
MLFCAQDLSETKGLLRRQLWDMLPSPVLPDMRLLRSSRRGAAHPKSLLFRRRKKNRPRVTSVQHCAYSRRCTSCFEPCIHCRHVIHVSYFATTGANALL